MKNNLQNTITITDGTSVNAELPVIVSASRATDIPAFYSEWLFNRLAAGYVKWTNPFNGIPSYVSFEKTRCFVFWTKNPEPMLRQLGRLDSFCRNYYFQYTLNDYDDTCFEPNVPKIQDRISVFKSLSGSLGKDRVIWRFDPICLSDSITADSIIDRIRRMGDAIAEYTSKLVFSFADIYSYTKVRDRASAIGIREPTKDEQEKIAKAISDMAKSWNITAATCGEAANFDGISHNRCIDDELMVKCFSADRALMEYIGAEYTEPNPLFEGGGWSIVSRHKDAGQRKACGCIKSKDIGQYNTCMHLCKYCYANSNDMTVLKNFKSHDCSGETITK